MERFKSYNLTLQFMNKPLYLKPAEIHSFYKGYPGPYMIGFSHLKKIFAGWENPNLTEEIRKFRADNHDYYGMMDPEETNILVGTIRTMQPQTIFEVGTGKGKLTEYMARAAPPNAVIHSLDMLPSQRQKIKYPLDPWNKNYIRHGDEGVGIAYKNAGLEGKVIQHLGDSAAFDFSPFKRKMDIVVVDANHGYEAAQNDLSNALEIVSPGGIVVLDDFDRMHHLAGVVWAVLREVVINGRVFYHVNDKTEGIESHFIFHPNIPEAIPV